MDRSFSFDRVDHSVSKIWQKRGLVGLRCSSLRNARWTTAFRWWRRRRTVQFHYRPSWILSQIDVLRSRVILQRRTWFPPRLSSDRELVHLICLFFWILVDGEESSTPSGLPFNRWRARNQRASVLSTYRLAKDRITRCSTAFQTENSTLIRRLTPSINWSLLSRVSRKILVKPKTSTNVSREIHIKRPYVIRWFWPPSARTCFGISRVTIRNLAATARHHDKPRHATVFCVCIYFYRWQRNTDLNDKCSFVCRS